MVSWIPMLALAVLAGQDPGATVTGVVRDAQSGEPVTGATVTLSDLGRATTSGESGRYLLRAIPAGLQHLEVRRIGYASRALHAFVPAAGDVEIHVALRPEPVLIRGVDVRPPLELRGADGPASRETPLDVRLSGAAVSNHPMLAEPDALSALAGGVVAVELEAPRGLHVRGGRPDQVSYLLDGIPVLSPYHSLGLFSAWNPDALLGLRLESRPSGGAGPDALSGVVAAETRRPGATHGARGAVSTSQVRATADGPVPRIGGGYLVSIRRGFPGVPAPEDEPSYVEAGSVDWLAKLEARVAGGELRLLGSGNHDRTGAASTVVDEETADPEEPLDHRFEWEGSSFGGEWSRPLFETGRLRFLGWYATADAVARWIGGERYPILVRSAREDAGGAAMLVLGEGVAETSFGIRTERRRALYQVRDLSGRPAMESATTAVAASVEHARDLGPALRVAAGAAAAVYGDVTRLAPHAEIHWSPGKPFSVSFLAERTHQAEQSLLNEESLVTLLFPAVLTLGAGAPGIPVARSDRVSLALEARPLPGTRIGAELYAREFRDLVLVAPVTSRPFATDTFAVGSGSASGAALELSMSGARHALFATYGIERVRYAVADRTYRPTFAATHRVEAGVLTFPWTTLSVRAGFTGVFGRRATAVLGPFEWEACNVLDLGCEFAGSPEQRAEPLGATRLPSYLRLDLGARKHWHLEVGPTDTQLGLYASVTNVLGRRNLLTRTLDPLTSDWSWIEMRSRVPLVVGLDWRF